MAEMKGQAFESLFFFIFLVALAAISTYIIVDVYLKSVGHSITKLQLNQQQSSVPQFTIHDIQYSENGSAALVSFTLYNLGSTYIPLKGWFIDFTTPNGGIICTTPIFLSLDDAAKIGIVESVYDLTHNVTLSYGQAIPANSVVDINLTIIRGPCLNATREYSSENLQMGFRVLIPPTQYYDIMRCSVDPYTGYSSCSSLGYKAYQ
ncbi:MAG: hypothetical protein ACO2OX_05245 [Candidatus Nanopusillus sp.]